MIRAQGIEARDVERVVVAMPQELLGSVNDRDMPDISLQHLVAVMITDGTMTFAAAHDFDRVKDPAIVRLRKRVEAVADPTIPNTVRGWRSRVTVELRDGRTLQHETLAAKGNPENPLTREDVQEKALDLMAPVLGKRRSLALMAALFNLEHLPNVRLLRKLYTV
jgi:2-methylcitrate dehydratase PrpD